MATQPFTVVVDAVRDPLNLDATGGTGSATAPVALTIAAGTTDSDGSESLTSVTIRDIPVNVTLTQNGTALARNGDGSYSLTPAQLNGLALVSNGYVGSFTGRVTINSAEAVTDNRLRLHQQHEQPGRHVRRDLHSGAARPVRRHRHGERLRVRRHDDDVAFLRQLHRRRRRRGSDGHGHRPADTGHGLDG